MQQKLTSPPTEWLNYHHLYYFWLIEQSRGLARAAERLGLTHSTLSAQLKALEDFLGDSLFERRGRRLVLTPFGAEVASYATDIFRLGAELVDVARGRSAGRQTMLRAGVVGTLPKSIAYRLLQPALDAAERTPVQVRQDTQERLIEELMAGQLHLVITDSPPSSTPPRVHVHRLGETTMFLYGTRKLAGRYGRAFPRHLEGAPMLVPAAGGLRRTLARWFAERSIEVHIEGEFDDVGLMRVFGGNGHGLFPVRAALRTEVEEAHGAVCLGALDGVREQYYAISTELRISHPGVAAIVEQARRRLADPDPAT